ncbi:MAG: glycosyltransferase family 9 protein, partial [Proteobacteria bacterium]|nr:glycosyltransferase family 9 protein [Pseudomonadota bacterium]
MNNPQNKKKILVIRNDKIGDFMLAWPSFALLKKQYPEAEITALVPSYTAELARLCEWIDDVLIDEKKNSFLSDVTHLKNIIKKKHFDISISLFSQTRTACALWLAGIKQRVGPATKIAQIFLNLRLRQRRSRSAKPEYEYNLDLIRYYININHDHAVDTPSPPYLRFEQEEISLLRKEISKKHEIPDN